MFEDFILHDYQLWKWQRDYLYIPTLKVTQLDALQLDETIYSIISNKFKNIFAYLNSSMVHKYMLEIELSIQLLVHYYILMNESTSIGAKLQNLYFLDQNKLESILIDLTQSLYANFIERALMKDSFLSKHQKNAWLFFHIALPYVYRRIEWGAENTNLNQDLKQRLLYTIKRVEDVFLVCDLIHFLIFFFNGKYVSIPHRLFGIRLFDISEREKRTFSLSFMSRQLYLKTIATLKQKLYFMRKYFNPTKIMEQEEDDGDDQQKCLLCFSERIILPYKAQPCHHVFCYYCIEGSFIDKNKCPKCHSEVSSYVIDPKIKI